MSRNNWPERSPMGPRHGSPAFASKQSKHNTHYFWQSPKLITIIIFFFLQPSYVHHVYLTSPLCFSSQVPGVWRPWTTNLSAIGCTWSPCDWKMSPWISRFCLRWRRRSVWRRPLGEMGWEEIAWRGCVDISQIFNYIYIIIWLYVCMIYVGLRKSLHETTIYTYIYIYLDVPEGLVDFCPLAQICLFIQEAFFDFWNVVSSQMFLVGLTPVSS